MLGQKKLNPTLFKSYRFPKSCAGPNHFCLSGSGSHGLSASRVGWYEFEGMSGLKDASIKNTYPRKCYSSTRP